MLVRALVSVALVAIIVAARPAVADCPGGVSNLLTVAGDVTTPTAFNLPRLQQFPPAQLDVTFFAGGSVVTSSYTGVLLWDLLTSSPVGGIVTDPNVKNDILHKAVVVTGTDCYEAVFGAGEIDP